MILFYRGSNGAFQQTQEQPSIAFGMAKVSLGMTVQQVEQHLSEAGRHLQFLPDKKTAIVHVNGNPEDTEGQVTFSRGSAIYAQFQMPAVYSADELAQEIAGAVDSMDTKTCTVSNFSGHGTGGGHSESIFKCGPRTFDVMTVQVLGSSVRTINVDTEIGQITEKWRLCAPLITVPNLCPTR